MRGQTRTVGPSTLILGILQSTHGHTAHLQDNAPPLPRPSLIQEAAPSESRCPSNSLSGCPVRLRGFGCEPIARGPWSEAGGRGERGRSHFGGRETIGRKRRGTGLWPQVTPAPLGPWPCHPGPQGERFSVLLAAGLGDRWEALKMVWERGPLAVIEKRSPLFLWSHLSPFTEDITSLSHWGEWRFPLRGGQNLPPRHWRGWTGTGGGGEGTTTVSFSALEAVGPPGSSGGQDLSWH